MTRERWRYQVSWFDYHHNAPGRKSFKHRESAEREYATRRDEGYGRVRLWDWEKPGVIREVTTYDPHRRRLPRLPRPPSPLPIPRLPGAGGDWDHAVVRRGHGPVRPTSDVPRLRRLAPLRGRNRLRLHGLGVPVAARPFWGPLGLVVVMTRPLWVLW